jgi:hypothetical protein
MVSKKGIMHNPIKYTLKNVIYLQIEIDPRERNFLGHSPITSLLQRITCPS